MLLAHLNRGPHGHKAPELQGAGGSCNADPEAHPSVSSEVGISTSTSGDRRHAAFSSR